MSDKPSLDVYERAACNLIEYACGYDAGRTKLDPVYIEVTEGRDGPGPEQRKKYSSCGDLFMWLMKRLDVEETWVNRTDDGVNGNWKPGTNVSDLAWCKLAFTPDSSWKPALGDCVIVWDDPLTRDSHVMAWLGPNEHKPGEFRCGNYGAGGMSAAVSPGAKIVSKPLKWNGKSWVYGTRTVRRSIGLVDAIKLSRGNIDLTGSPRTAEDLIDQATGEDADAIAGTKL